MQQNLVKNEVKTIKTKTIFKKYHIKRSKNYE